MTVRFFRGEKSTPNANAVRTLVTGVLISIAILLGADPAIRLWQTYGKDRPWVANDLTIMPDSRGVMLIHDTIIAPDFIGGSRQVWAEGEDGLRICGVIRSDSWGPGRSDRTWTLDAFTGGQCEGIEAPFRICNTFTLRSDHDVEVRDGPYCTDFVREG